MDTKLQCKHHLVIQKETVIKLWRWLVSCHKNIAFHLLMTDARIETLSRNKYIALMLLV